MSDWLDTETKAILQGGPPDKLAPADTAGFTLVLLSKSSDRKRLGQALAKAGCRDPGVSIAILDGKRPQVVATGLTMDDALLGQFELACCDSAAVFLRDAIVAEDDREYLSKLYAGLLAGEEFAPVEIEIHAIPRDDRGGRFLGQFLGRAADDRLFQVGLPLRQTVIHKKARLMLHWGGKIGADVRMKPR